MKNDTSITVAFIGPYQLIPGLTYDGHELIGGYDQIDVAVMSDLSKWGTKSWWYWNQKAMDFAIADINNDPKVLPNTTIKIRRFRNSQVASRKSKYNAGSIALAHEIGTQHKDIVAVFGNYAQSDTIADAEVYGYMKIPQCSGTSVSRTLWNKNNYPYLFQTMSSTGLAEAVSLLLSKWSVKRVAIISTISMAAQESLCGNIATVLVSRQFEIVAKVLSKPNQLDYIAKTLERADARYIISCGSQDDNASIYFGLAQRNQSVGPGYVWIMDNVPFTSQNGTAKWGPNYFKAARGVITVYGTNIMTAGSTKVSRALRLAINEFQTRAGGANFSSSTIAGWFNINQMYDCPRIYAAGLNNLLNSDASLTSQMLATRELDDRLNYTLFKNTGYTGLLGDPIQLTANGDISATFYAQSIDGKSAGMSAFNFAITNIGTTEIKYLNNTLPVFYDGTSMPPPDGPIYDEVLITGDSSNGRILYSLAGSGIIIATLFWAFTALFGKKPSVRAGSSLFLTCLTIGAIPAYAANFFYIGKATVLQCNLRFWLQMLSFVVMVGSVIVKNTRVCLIYGTLKNLPKSIVRDFFWLMILLVLIAIEVLLLGVWTFLSKTTVAQRIRPEYKIENTCIYKSRDGYTSGGVLWAYNIMILMSLFVVTWKSHVVPPAHSEFSILLITSMVLFVSALLLVLLSPTDSIIDFEIKQAIIIYFNITSILCMQMLPRVAALIHAEVIERGKSWRISRLTVSTYIRDSTKLRKRMPSSNQDPLLSQKSSVARETVSRSGVHTEVKQTIKLTRQFLVVYRLKKPTDWMARKWVDCGVSIGVVRNNTFLQFQRQGDSQFWPLAYVVKNPDGLSVTAKTHGKISYSRVSFYDSSQGLLEVDFIKSDEAAEFKNVLLDLMRPYT